MKTPIMPVALFAVAVLGATPHEVRGAITPPKIIQTEEVKFPPALDFTAISSGEANVTLKIDATGRLVDVLVTGYSNEEFGRTAAEAVRRWKYEPAMKDGKPFESRVKLDIKFTSEARVVTLMPVETPAALFRRAHVPDNIDLVCGASDLDKPLTVLETETPVHPGRGSGPTGGRTVVDFYVDEHGRPRLPVVTQTTDPAFSEAVMNALDRWRFSVPTRAGRPVIVRMQQEFVFTKDA